MTATEQLRKLLDERGVEYTTDDGKYLKETCWAYMGDFRTEFIEFENGETRFELNHWHFTPQQAIAATLCGDECEIVSYYEASTRGEVGRERVKLSCGHIVERHSKYCQECGRKIQKAVEQ